ncbi:MAG: hypothetical protein AAGI23_01655 [Bacteroidota bacterium]
MKYLLLLLIFFHSCNDQEQQSQEISSSEEPEKVIQHSEKQENLDLLTIESVVDTLIEDFEPEIAVNSIELLHPNSVLELGKDLKPMERPQVSEFPHVILLNQSRQEMLKLIFYYGSLKNAFSEFELTVADEEYPNAVVLEDDYFESGRGLRLEMSEAQVKAILGEPNVSLKDGLRYRLVDEHTDDSDFLAAYNYPSYYIDATFVNDKLEKYRFGFDYP